jgi:hypothetical protein
MFSPSSSERTPHGNESVLVPFVAPFPTGAVLAHVHRKTLLAHGRHGPVDTLLGLMMLLACLALSHPAARNSHPSIPVTAFSPSEALSASVGCAWFPRTSRSELRCVVPHQCCPARPFMRAWFALRMSSALNIPYDFLICRSPRGTGRIQLLLRADDVDT